MKIFGKKRNRWLSLGSLLGALMLLAAVGLHNWKNDQVDNYNAGLEAYLAGDMQKAVQLFDRSLGAYRTSVSQENPVLSSVLAAPDRSVAARASFQKAKALLQMKQAPAALAAFKESLLLNPGNGYDNMLLAEAQRMEKEARYTQYDLELLFKANPSMAQQEAEGKSKRKGQPGIQQVPGTEPGNQPGKGDRKKI